MGVDAQISGLPSVYAPGLSIQHPEYTLHTLTMSPCLPTRED